MGWYQQNKDSKIWRRQCICDKLLSHPFKPPCATFLPYFAPTQIARRL